ncbi:porin family protein [Endozoicomonas sp. G2_1]|uniref:porin family protein n=1 Tax=Endozoicomonas sp. G2_1 TaxID=2821091 RepID=UPI001ADA619A|nr:porin family protein [Endozoicomonas sp. G2_1]MBO9491921.1 porin family protein [Endozoicomonas sp. G2_1]
MRAIPLFCALTISLSSSLALAEVNQHTLGIGYEIGTADVSQDSDVDNIDFDIGQVNLVYNYHLNENWALQTNYLIGRSDSFNLTFGNIFSDNKVDYNSIAISVRGALPISSSSNIYAAVGGHRYDYEVTDKSASNILSDDDGFSFTGELGLEVSFNDSFGGFINYRYMKLGSELEFNAIGAGVTYSF